MANENISDNWYPRHPSIEERKDKLLWLSIQPKKPTKVNFDNRSSVGSLDSVSLGDGSKMYFLMPNEFSYSINHRWDDYSSVIGMIKEMEAKIIPQAAQFFSTVKGIAAGAGALTSGDLSGIRQSIETNSGPNVSDIAMKNDNPVVYTNSDRKSLSVTIDLAVYEDTYKDVFEPIDKLIKMSTPEDIAGAGVKFNYPYIFEIGMGIGANPSAFTMFHIRNAAITSITPEFTGPYIDGYPSKGSAQIQFADIDPLFRDLSFTSNSKVTVTRK